MDTPADKTAKRISTDEWFARYHGVEFAKSQKSETRARALQRLLTPADRIAVRT